MFRHYEGDLFEEASDGSTSDSLLSLTGSAEEVGAAIGTFLQESSKMGALYLINIQVED